MICFINNTAVRFFACLFLSVWMPVIMIPVASLWAGETENTAVAMEWDGHLRLYSRAVFPRSGTAQDAVGLDPNYDGFIEYRLNNRVFLNSSIYTEIHWEALAGGGNTRKDGNALKDRYPELFPNGLFSPPNDDRRFFDLTAVVHEDEETFSHHRLDRALISFSPAWGEIRIGRQAVTWGHGFTFNPMDLFNPFAPTDLERDYKTGDDLALARFSLHETDVELVYVARRDPVTGQTGLDENSLGAKIHFFAGDIEVDLMVLRHYEDGVAGIGMVGYAGGAAWRFNLTGTFLNDESRGRSAYASAVANIDYSWVWLDRNWYGFLELYYNGLSDADYSDHFSDPALSERLARGELYALGRFYASGSVNLELHPLLNLYLTPIVNLNDGSGILLPRLVYNMSDNLRLSVTGAFHWGGDGTEYGGYEIPNRSFSQRPSDSLSAWVTWYF